MHHLRSDTPTNQGHQAGIIAQHLISWPRLVDPDPKPRGASLSDAVQLADWSASPIVSELTLRGESLVEAERGMGEHLHLLGEWRDEWGR